MTDSFFNFDRFHSSVGSDGEIVDSDEEEDEDDEEMYKEAQQKLEQEKQAILANQNMIAEVKS